MTLFNGVGGNTAVRVDPGVTATLGVALNGGGTLASSTPAPWCLTVPTATPAAPPRWRHAGGRHNSALGSGLLTTANGTTLDSNTAVSLANALNVNGSLTLGGSNALTLAGTVAGTGSPDQEWHRHLTLSGNNTYAGPTALNAGGLILASNSAWAVAPERGRWHHPRQQHGGRPGQHGQSGRQPGHSGHRRPELNGLVSGSGGLTKTGAGNLTLNGANAYLGGTQLNTGSLTLGNASALGSGALAVNGATTLTPTRRWLANNTSLNAALTVGGSNDLSLNGVVDGTGSLTKAGGQPDPQRRQHLQRRHGAQCRHADPRQHHSPGLRAR